MAAADPVGVPPSAAVGIIEQGHLAASLAMTTFRPSDIHSRRAPGTEDASMSDEPAQEKTRRTRFRFRLRSFMLAMAIFCVALGWITHRAQVQREAVLAVERAGGAVMYQWEWQWKNSQPVRTGTTRWPDWLIERVGIDYLSHVNYVDLGDRASDELLAQVGQLRELEYLRLTGSPVTDATQ